MIETNTLKNKFLEYAFKGELSSREKNDTSVEEYLEKIRKSNKVKINKDIKINERFEIPLEWKWIKLGEYLDVRDGTHDTPQYVENGFPLITSKNIENGEIIFNDIKYISRKDFEEINKRSKVDVGDILFPMIGTIGDPAIVSDSCDYAIKNVALLKKVLKDTNEKYINYSLLYFEKIMAKEARGGLQSFVSLDYLRNFAIPIPSIEEQKRIVEKLDSIFKCIDNIDKNYLDICNDCKIVKNKIIDRIMLEIPVDKKDWTCLSRITNDETLNDGNWILSEDMVQEGSVNLIQLGNIGDCCFKETNYKHLSEEHFYELGCRQIYPGYLLINRLVADKMLTCIIPEIDGILITSVDACWIAPNEDIYNLKYIMYMLSSSYFQNEVKLKGKGVTRFRISKTNLVSIPFPLPEKKEQDKIVEKIEEALSLIDGIIK